MSMVCQRPPHKTCTNVPKKLHEILEVGFNNSCVKDDSPNASTWYYHTVAIFGDILLLEAHHSQHSCQILSRSPRVIAKIFQKFQMQADLYHDHRRSSKSSSEVEVTRLARAPVNDSSRWVHIQLWMVNESSQVLLTQWEGGSNSAPSPLNLPHFSVHGEEEGKAKQLAKHGWTNYLLIGSELHPAYIVFGNRALANDTNICVLPQ